MTLQAAITYVSYIYITDGMYVYLRYIWHAAAHSATCCTIWATGLLSTRSRTCLPTYVLFSRCVSYLLLFSQAAVAKENDEAVEALLLGGHSPHQVIT